VAGTLGLSVLAALASERAGTPLPWLIGPLLACALCGVLGVAVQGLPVMRNIGQWIIGAALGLYFTPAVLKAMASLVPALLIGIAWALFMGFVFYRLLAAVLRADGAGDDATAFFSGAIGGASEMVVLGERHGGRVDRIASAHSLRVLIVVLTIPLAFQWLGLKGADATVAGPGQVHLGGLLVLAVLSLVGALVMRRLHAPNPWVLGALAVTLVLTGSGVELSALPTAVTHLGQLFIGVALGTRFTPEFARSAPRWLVAVALGTVALIMLSAGFAWLLARLAGLHWATVLLGTSPGGIAEMCITAKVMQLGVPTVTAFHVTRYVVVLVATAPLYRWLARRRAPQSS
jgi:uncharacterized protein